MSTLPAGHTTEAVPKRSWRVRTGVPSRRSSSIASRSPAKRAGVARDDHVELPGGTAEEQVADRPADQGHVLVALGEGRQLLAAGPFVEPFEDDRRVAHTGMRTGTPASARVAFASATVKRR